ncbi:MAG TPA: hypothetical protein VH592_05435 [Gemmataceae bacterium]
MNWAASAIIEFTYLEMVLGQERLPAEAEVQLLKLLPFAGAEGVAQGTFRPAGFCRVTPGPRSRPRKDAGQSQVAPTKKRRKRT